jgi:hypothetical protein
MAEAAKKKINDFFCLEEKRVFPDEFFPQNQTGSFVRAWYQSYDF